MAVHDLHDPDDAGRRAERGAEHGVRREARLPVDRGVEARIVGDVVDPHRHPALQDGPCDATIGREAEPAEPRRDRGIVRRRLEIQLVGGRIEQHHRRPLGVEGLAALGHDQRHQLVQVDTRREGAREIV